MPVDSRKDDFLGAIAVIVILIGTATGDSYAMLGMSVVSLVLIAVFCRQKIGRGAILVALVAAITATAIGIALAMQ